MSRSHNNYEGRHVKLDKKFNFVEMGEGVPNEEIIASKLDPNNLIIVLTEQSPPSSQASHNSSTSTTVSFTSTIKIE